MALNGVELGSREEESVAVWGVFKEADLALEITGQNLPPSKVFKEL